MGCVLHEAQERAEHPGSQWGWQLPALGCVGQGKTGLETGFLTTQGNVLNESLLAVLG